MLKPGKGEGLLWHVGDDRATLTKVTSPRELFFDQTPIVFIHGVEYSGPEEAMRDLVLPMLEALGPSRVRDRPIYIFAWNSLLTNDVRIFDLYQGNLKARAKLLFKELPRCKTYLLDVERRAREAAKALLPFAVEWNAENRVGPTVITHSMGGLVWAETLKKLYEASEMLTKPGVWWSLQPAMERRSFSKGGDYEVIPKIYTGRESAKAMIWFSRMDFILSSIYMLSKRGLALGQWGSINSEVPQRDVTRWAREAHGMQHLTSRLGHFFKRVSTILPSEAETLGL
jgi:hypothetical protein